MAFWKSFFSTILGAVAGFGMAYVIGLIFRQFSLLLELTASSLLIALLAGFAIHYRGHVLRSSALWGAAAGYAAYLAALMWLLTHVPTIAS